jgi:prevent-host-death family protein
MASFGAFMTTVGIRELKTHTSDVIRRVEAGETIDITNHGRIVPRIVPPALTQEEIEQSLALLDEMEHQAQAIDWPEGSSIDHTMKDLRREL